VRAAGVADVLVRIVERRRERLAAEGFGDGLAEALARGQAAAEPVVPGPGSARSPGAATLAAESTGPADSPLTATTNRFLAALSATPAPAVIAEIKMGSPRLGSLAGRFDPEETSRAYAAAGAAALSVVVEPDFFGGSYELLARCRAASGLPALAKDFVVHPVQLERAGVAGADAVLLIAALYDRAELAALAARARRLGLVPLIETHDPADLDLLAGAGTGDAWELVGINHRDLRTFEVDLGRSAALLPRLPAGALKVAESGIASAADVARLAAGGFDAFLIGESLLLAPDPAAKLRELRG
jgi:indole-3-glycerol phosphate synthase